MCTVMGLELNIDVQERSVNYILSQDKNLNAKWNNAEDLNANSFDGSVSNVIMRYTERFLKARNIDGFKRQMVMEVRSVKNA